MLTTKRLLLREWKDSDRGPFAALNADPRVMRFMPGVLSREESDRSADRIQSHFVKHGFGLLAAELRATGTFIGFIGLSEPLFQAHFTPCVEIGWRLSVMHWNQGLATEGANEALRYGFGRLGLAEIVSFTITGNAASRRVMEKIGMRHNPVDDFDHPELPTDHPLRRHVLYRLRSTNWKTAGVTWNKPPIVFPLDCS